MSQQYFTDAEWQVMLQSPMHVVKAVILADKTDPVTFLKEAYAAVSLLTEQQQQPTSSDLVNALMADMKTADAQEPIQGEQLLLKKEFQLLGELQGLKDAGEGRTQALAHLQQVSSILAGKVTLNQADEFRKWLVALATSVANAVKEGGFMGIGGERTSSDEAAAIKKIEQALAIK